MAGGSRRTLIIHAEVLCLAAFNGAGRRLAAESRGGDGRGVEQQQRAGDSERYAYVRANGSGVVTCGRTATRDGGKVTADTATKRVVLLRRAAAAALLGGWWLG